MSRKKRENISFYALYEQLKRIVPNFYRPFRIREVFSLFEFLKQEPNINTLRKYFQNLEKDKILVKTDWSNYARSTYYLPTNSVEKNITIPFASSYKYDTEELFTTFLNPLNLIELTNIYKYLPFNQNTVMNELFNWYDETTYRHTYELLPYEIKFMNFKPIIIHAFTDELHNLNIQRNENDITKNKITFSFNTKQQRSAFFTLDGESLVEVLRKAVLILSVKNNMELSKISDYLQTIMTIIVIDSERDLDIKREKLEARFNEANRPDPPEIKKFKNQMIELIDLEIKTMEIKKDPDKSKKLKEFNSKISLKEDMVKKVKREINQIKKDKEKLLKEG